MKKLSGALAVALVVSGCASTKTQQISSRQDFLSEATRTYEGETKDRVIKAAETILKVSDPDDWDFRYTAGGFTALRSYFIYAVLVAAKGKEKWEFTVDERGAAQFASMSVSQSGTTATSTSANQYESAMNSVPLYRLFYKRMDYMLGRRDDWVSCEEESTQLEAAGESRRALGGLCGPTSGGRDAPAPEPLPARPSRKVAARGAAVSR